MKQRRRRRYLAWVNRKLGNRCRGGYYAGCIICESYKIKDETGRFPSFDEAYKQTGPIYEFDSELTSSLQSKI